VFNYPFDKKILLTRLHTNLTHVRPGPYQRSLFIFFMEQNNSSIE